MSRVLVEACAVGTPVIVHDHALLANLVRRHGLGLVIDCNDSRAFREARVELTTNGDGAERYAPALALFLACSFGTATLEAISGSPT